jgi:DNA replication protein DnaC
MNLNEIERTLRQLRQLRLSGIAATLNTCVLQAQSSQQPFLETLAALLQDELDQRRTRLTQRRLKHSRLDEQPSLADFDWRFNPKLPRQACFELHSLKFIAEGANALLVGKPGTGKSHVAKAVAYQATLQGLAVRYVEADTEFAQYALCSAAEQAVLLRAYVCAVHGTNSAGCKSRYQVSAEPKVSQRASASSRGGVRRKPRAIA